MTRRAQKKKIAVSTVSKIRRKKLQTFQETPVECSNGSEASGEEPPFVKEAEELQESNPHYFQIENF